jgi:drug/metabolite transporter (DMT)-like permease
VRPASSAVRARGLSGPVLALIALLAVALVWGSSFPLTKVLLESLSARQYLAVRFVIAAVVMLAVFPRAVLALPRRALVHGALLGVLYGLAQLIQTTGLEYTPATVSGFITGLYVVLTPLSAAVLLRARVGARAWVGSVLAVVGLGVLALHGLSLGYGEWLTLASALLFALHIVGLGAWAKPREALGVAVVQMAGIAVVCVLAAVPEGFAAPSRGVDWVILLYLALVSGGLAMVVQTWAQSLLSPSRAAVIMSSEPGWSAVLSIGFFGEPLTWRVVVGGALMLAAMLVVELGPRPPTEPAGPEDLPKLAA